MKKRIIIDTDVGYDVDDIFAITLALKSPELKIEGITTVYGDTFLRAQIVLKLLRIMDIRDVEVAAGVTKPLLRERKVWWGGREGEGILTEKDKNLRPINKNAVDFIIEKIMKNPKGITLVALGPLTNIALAVIKEPKIIENLKDIVMMGGVARIFSNASNLPYIEHNIECDPESASVVFNSEIPITMVGLDVTTEVPISNDHLERIKKTGTKLTDTLEILTKFWWDFIKTDSSCMHDPLALSYCIKPEFLKTMSCKIIVEREGKHTTGQTIVIPSQESNKKVAYYVDKKNFIEFLIERICSNT